MSTNTSRSRFDESRRFTGVYQQMGRVILDSDWNEEVRIRTNDAARRSADVAEGAPGDGFSIGPMFMFDPVVSGAGWSGTKADASVLGTVIPEITLARRDPASLPYVLRARGYTEVRRDLPNVLDLSAAKSPSMAVAPFAVSRLAIEIRVDLPTGQSLGTPSLVIIGANSEVSFALGALVTNWKPAEWTQIPVEANSVASLGQITGFKLTGLPPQASVHIAGLQVLRQDSNGGVIRGGDGTMAGGGVMFVGGLRACLPADVEYTSQPDYPMPPQPQGSSLYPALVLSANLLNADWSAADSLTISAGGSPVTVDLQTLQGPPLLSGDQALDTLVSLISAASDGTFTCKRRNSEMIIRSTATGPTAQLSVTGAPSSMASMMFGAGTVTAQGGDADTAPQLGGVPTKLVSQDIGSLDPSLLNGLTLVITAPSGQDTCTFAGVATLDHVITQIMAAATGVLAEIFDNGSVKYLALSPQPGQGFTTTIDIQGSSAASLLGFSASNRSTGLPDVGDPGAIIAYLDLWEIPVTAREDAFLAEPALDGMETASRMRLVQQVKTFYLEDAGDPIVMPSPTGGGALTTSFAQTDDLIVRYPTDSFDACRDRCLDTASIATGTGYRGTENLHVRVQVLATPQGPAALWARDNGSTLLMLTEDVAAGATRLRVSPEDALRLSAGDFVVIEDRITRLQPEGGAVGGDPKNLRRAELRRLRAVDPATGALDLEATGAAVGRPEEPLYVGGPLLTGFLVADQAAVRRWDGADLIEAGYRYNLPDGIEFAFSGAPADYRPGDFWSFTARVHDPDGQSVGRVEALVEAPPHGPVHRYAPLLRVGMSGSNFTDIRPRFLPLHEVRKRLIELAEADGDHAAFTVVVGDGESSFGDVDQDLAHGITGDDAIRAAIDRVGEGGGTIYIRAGSYALRGPIIISSRSRLRIVGDGKATVINAAGLGGAFFIDQSGADGAVLIQDLCINDGAPIEISSNPDGSAQPPDPGLAAGDLLANDTTALVVADLLASFGGAGAPPRAVEPIMAAYTLLRWLQKNGDAGASALSDLLAQLPRGAVTISDSSVELRGCVITGPAGAPPEASAVFITGASDAVKIHRCRLEARTGITALPLASYFSDAFLAAHPGAGLSVTDLQIEHNDIVPPSTGGRGVHGVHIIDGAFDAVAIRGNHVEAFVVGVEVADHAELHGYDTGKRFLIADNRVRDCSVVGIQVGADGADVVRNEVACPSMPTVLADAGLFQAGIQITGQRVRVHGSWISMAATESKMYGAYAGIAVGDIMEDGASAARPVFDVEITDNRVEGQPANQGSGALVTGVLIGGPQAVYDVRVRGNELRYLGDAGVRVLGNGIATGRIRIEDNRIEQVCQVNGFLSYDAAAQIEMLTPPGVTLDWGSTDHADPSSVVDFLYSTSVDPALITPLIDAALRAVEVLTLRGAVTLCRVAGADVRGNGVNGVGYTSVTATSSLDLAAEVRVAGVAVVGGSEVVIEDNHVEDVRAPFSGLADSGSAGSGATPLDAVTTALALVPTSTTGQVVQATLHDMAAGLNGKLLQLIIPILEVPLVTAGPTRNAQLVANNQAIAGALCEIDTLCEHLTAANLGNIATSLKNAGDMVLANNTFNTEQAAREDPDTVLLFLYIDVARHLAAHAAYVTAGDDASRQAWNAVQNLAGALVPTTAGAFDVSASISAVLAQLKLDLSTLLEDIPDCDLTAGLTSLVNTYTAAGYTPTQNDARFAIGGFSLLAAYRDEMVRYAGFNGAAALGYRSDVIVSLAQTIKAKVTTLPSDYSAWSSPHTGNSPIENLRPSVRSLSHVLSDAGSDLAAYVASDFLAIDRVIPILTTDAAGTITHMLATLDRVIAWAGDQLNVTPANDGGYADAAVRLGSARAQYAIIQAAIQQIDAKIKHIATLPDPTIVPPYTFPYTAEIVGSIGIGNELFKLFGVVRDDAELSAIAVTAVTAASRALPTTAPTDPFDVVMQNVGDILAGMLVTASEILAASAGVNGEDASPSQITERRIAGMGALLLALRGATPLGDPSWQAPMDLLQANVVLAMAETSAGSAATDSASKVLAAAQTVVVATSPDPSAVRAQLAHLADVIDRIATSAAGMFATAEVTAAAVLVRAAKLALDPTSIDADVLKSVQDYLSRRRAEVSSSIVDRIAARTDVTDARADLRDALLRIAIGEETRAPAAAEPDFQAPESADGMFAAAVDERLSVAHNTIESTLTGVTILSYAGHVLACTPAGAPGNLLIEVMGNRLRGCSISALEVMPRISGDVVVVVESNHAVACADLGAGVSALDRGDATLALQVPGAQAVARFAGTGDLLLSGNVFQGNGHGQPAALLHEILVDWRGNLVLRGNTVRHNGGGHGGAAMLILTELLDVTQSNRVALVGKLSRSPALAVEPAPAPTKRALPATRTPWRAASFTVGALTPTVTFSNSHYVQRTTLRTRVTSIREFLILDKVAFRPIRLAPPIARTSVQLEGNHVQATGPALLLLGKAGGDIVSATIVGNELRSFGGAGAVYVRHTDATVFNGNECESLSAVNVVILRPQDAPVAVCGNVILGSQPVAQVSRSINAARADIKKLTAARRARASSLVVIGGTHVVSVGNATTAGALIVGADEQTELNN